MKTHRVDLSDEEAQIIAAWRIGNVEELATLLLASPSTVPEDQRINIQDTMRCLHWPDHRIQGFLRTLGKLREEGDHAQAAP